MDKLQMMVKLKEKIYNLKRQQADASEVAKLEKLLDKLQTTPNAKFI
ncbi:MAG: hypothetical protein OIF32_02530 [Campylobacterales bacterium]|nr:hypothetical protein [Campylobacterales bacterium]